MTAIPCRRSRLLTEGIPTLAPGKTIPILFDVFLERGDRPDAYSVDVSYEGERGRRYQERVPLDLGVYRNLEYVTTHTIHDVHARLKEIRDVIKKWSTTGGGLLVVTPHDVRRREEEWRESREQRRPTPASDGSGDTESGN